MPHPTNTDQHYALNSDGIITHICHAEHKGHFKCPYCNGEMIAKQGKIRKWHFAHKVLSENCTYETYLHALAKIKIRNWFYQSDKILINLDTLHQCSEIHNCQWANPDLLYDCEKHAFQTFDLKNYFNSCTIEQTYKNFRADLFLYNNQIKRDPIFIEICVKHPCEQEKINSGLRIIELIIESEDDIEQIINSPIEENDHIRLYNFKTQIEFTDSLNKPLSKFILYKSAKGFCSNTDCKTYTSHNPASIFEITTDCQNGFFEYSTYELGLAWAQKYKYPVRSCFLCKYHRRNLDAFDNDFPIFCCLYKKLGTNKYCKSTQAWNCEAFRVDKQICNDIINYFHGTAISIWENEPNIENTKS